MYKYAYYHSATLGSCLVEVVPLDVEMKKPLDGMNLDGSGSIWMRKVVITMDGMYVVGTTDEGVIRIRTERCDRFESKR